MLVLTRRMNEILKIGDDVSICILGISGGQVRLGIDAPKDVEVHREEIWLKIKEEGGNTGDHPMTGTISNILQHKDYGFIYVNKIEKTVFFHSNNVADGCFAQLSDGDDVEFVLKKEKKGFIAYSVKSLEPILELENEITTISNLP